MGLQIGLIGTDTSHTVAFARILNDKGHPFHVEGGSITQAVRFCSRDFELSYSREEGFSRELAEVLRIPFTTLEEIGGLCDAFLIEAADGRKHLELFSRIAVWGKPVYIDKPFAVSYDDAAQMMRLAKQHGTPLMSSSALRFAAALRQGLTGVERSGIRKATVSCPLVIEPTQSRYFWYGIHGIETLFAIMGMGCERIDLEIDEAAERIIGVWADGAVGEVRCCFSKDQPYEAVIETAEETIPIRIDNQIPYYASLLENVVSFFRTGVSPVASEETLEIIAFIEAAEKRYKEHQR